jgi:hypothetical protein
LNESKVNHKVMGWAIKNGYTYKGVCKSGHVPVPLENRDVLIDHQLEKLPSERFWVEGKGTVNLSRVLEAIVRLMFGCYYGGGKGLLATDGETVEKTLKYRDFLKWLCEGVSIGLFNADEEEITWLNR